MGLWVGALTGFAGSILISLDPSKAGDATATATAAAGVRRTLFPTHSFLLVAVVGAPVRVQFQSHVTRA